MTILVTNNDIIDFSTIIGTPEILTDVSTQLFHDVDYTPYSMKIANNDVAIQDIPATSQGWVHFMIHVPTNELDGFGDIIVFELTDSTDGDFFRIVQDSDAVDVFKNPLLFEYWDGAAWVTLPNPVPENTLAQIDIDFKIDASAGHWIVYSDGQEINRFTGKTNHNGNTIDRASFYGSKGTVPGAGVLTRFIALSQFIMSNSENTIDMRLATLEIDGEGATSAWTGLFTDVNEQLLDTNTKITSGTSNDVSTYTITNLSANVLASTFLNILSVNVHHYVRDNAGTPGDVQQAVRISATDFFGPTDTSIGAGYALSINRFTTNPNTTNPWALTDIAALEIGAKSI